MEKKLEKALEIIEGLDWETLEPGTYPVDDDIYYMVNEYETKYSREARYEAHQKYVDIQYMLEGEERMEFADVAALEVDEAYDSDRDVVFLKDPKTVDSFVVSAGDYRIFYPEDAHKPGLCIGEPCRVKKIVAKVRL